jgi:hypothetical protein
MNQRLSRRDHKVKLLSLLYFVFFQKTVNHLFSLLISGDNLLYKIKNKAIDKFLSSIKANDESEPFKPILKNSKESKANENVWQREYVKPTVYFRLKNRLNGYYLSSNNDGSVFLAKSDKQDDFQQWNYLESSDYVLNRKSGLRLTVAGDENESLIISSPNNEENAADSYQKWELIPYEINPSKKQTTTKKMAVRSTGKNKEQIEPEQTTENGKKLDF